MNYQVKTKVDGKWFTVGNVKKNQFGNYSLGVRMSPQLKSAFAGKADGEWVNFSLFEDEGSRLPAPAATVDDNPPW